MSRWTTGEGTVQSRKQTARLAGALYMAWSGAAAVGVTYFPSAFMVRGDAAATADRITSSPLLYQLAVVSQLLAGVTAIYMVLTMYRLFEDVDRGHARLLVAMVLVQVPIMFAIMLTQIAPLVLLNGADYWSAFDKPQLDALALGSLSLYARGQGALGAYWGLWLLPLGALVYRSTFIPRILGVFLIVAGCAYLVSTLTNFFFPAYARLLFMMATVPAGTLGEAGFVGWLLIKGVRTEPLQAS